MRRHETYTFTETVDRRRLSLIEGKGGFRNVDEDLE